ncbi:MAG TPA: NUDIX domain-containing protein [Candidatus Limnocylindrales bacterium]
MSDPDELVLVVPRAVAVGDGGWRGVRRGIAPRRLEALQAAGVYRPRSAVEPDPAWKQLIPYLVLRDGPRWFLMHRTRAGGDARLHDLYSIGVGGHLNPGDGGIEGGLRRELAEELETDLEPRFELVGLLNDDTTEVGSVHLGVVFVAETAGTAVSIRETDKLTAEWADEDAVRAVEDRLETWSALVFDALSVGR